MSGKVKNRLYLAVAVLGISALVAEILLDDLLTSSQGSAMIGVGAGLFGFGIAKWCVGRWSEKDPEFMRQSEIEAKDERNQLIRMKSQAICGEILHWMLMAGAWVGIFLDAPLWITILLVGVFLLKTAGDLVLMAYYQRKM